MTSPTLHQPIQRRPEGDEGDDDHVAPLSSTDKGGEVGRLSDAEKDAEGGQGGGMDARGDTCSFTKGGICLLTRSRASKDGNRSSRRLWMRLGEKEE